MNRAWWIPDVRREKKIMKFENENQKSVHESDIHGPDEAKGRAKSEIVQCLGGKHCYSKSESGCLLVVVQEERKSCQSGGKQRTVG